MVLGENLEEHISENGVLQRLREKGLKVQPNKSEFLRKEVEFLGHVVTLESSRTLRKSKQHKSILYQKQQKK